MADPLAVRLRSSWSTTTEQKQAADLIDAMLEMLGEWLEFAEDKFGEFNIDGEEDCLAGRLCPQCESNGCIQRKIRLTRRLVGSALTPEAKP